MTPSLLRRSRSTGSHPTEPSPACRRRHSAQPDRADPPRPPGPLASSPIATSCAVVPIVSSGTGLVRTTDASSRRIVTVTVPTTPPLAAEILATPSPTTLIVAPAPDPETVATDGASDVHVSDGD